MGSQTLEILRQGIWASITGGWFFDPHQEIFCNTFHMYLWLALLLIPFVIHLTAETVILPSILYPLTIFLFFIITKLVNHKLHILFDGEELLEDDKNKEGDDSDKDKSSSPNDSASKENNDDSATKIDNETSITSDPTKRRYSVDNLEEIVLNVAKPGKDSTTDNLGQDEDKAASESLTPDKNTPQSELVLSPVVLSPAERAVVVDLHSTKADFKEQDTKNGVTDAKVTQTNTSATDNNSIQDDNLIIANKPMASEFGGGSGNIGTSKIKTANETSSNFKSKKKVYTPDSSWGSSSDCSTISDASDNDENLPNIEPKVKFSPVESSEYKQKNGATGKSESNLSRPSTKKKTTSNRSDKAISLPALESQNTTASTTQATKTFQSDPEKLMSVNKDTINDANDSPGIRVFSDIDVGSLDKTDSLANQRTIVRSGAIRMTGRGTLRTRNRQRTNSGSPATSLLNQENEQSGSGSAETKHLAMTHEDTSTGAVHCFQDEFGQWYTYTFGDDSAQPIAQPSLVDFIQTQIPSTSRRRESNASNSLLNDSTSYLSQLDNDPLRILNDEMTIPTRWRYDFQSQRSNFSGATSTVKVEQPAPKKYYMLPIIRDYSVKVSFDRLALLSLLDRNKNHVQAFLSVVLATLVAFLGYNLLTRDYFYDFWLFVICFIIAKCQFSLLKSVQPDSASPIHGHNSIIVFSRSVYFCVLAVFIIIVDEGAKMTSENQSVTLYGVRLYSHTTLVFARDLLVGLLLAFPVVFLLGLLPQINTFIMHSLEQFDIHIFGGSATTSLSASIYAFFRAILFTLILVPFCYIPLEISSNTNAFRSQHVLFSVFSGLLLALSYQLSRSTSNPEILWRVFERFCCVCCKTPTSGNGVGGNPSELNDPLPDKLLQTVKSRAVHDLITCIIISFLVFAVHLSTAFTTLQPSLSYIIYILTGVVGILTHYLLPQLRKQLPWLFVSSPILKSYEYNLYEWQEHSKIMWFERLYVILSFVEKNVLYPIVYLSAITQHSDQVAQKFGNLAASFIITICAIKLLRSAFTNTSRQHIILIWTVLFFEYDFRGCSETFLVDYFFMSIFVDKTMELYLKFKFILTYTAPWQITWGSAFHAFAQPVSVPHCGMLIVQAIVAAFFSSPLNPFLGSAIFMTSYMRPIKFWEKDYNTKRVDHSNTRLSSHIDSNPGADDNNLNSIFYEHLTRSLQHSLCGDLLLGRWGNFSNGDCFIMASDYLNALVHIIEVGNGYVTFQLRGLEFRGTYCQQREVEAITENVDDDEGCCCCHVGHVQNLLSFNAAFGLRWLAWEVVQSKYILEGYSVSDNTAVTMFQMFDLRKIFITYYVTSIVFYCVRNKKLKTWLADESLMSQLEELQSSTFVDFDTVFRPVTDKDYDLAQGGVTRASFCQNYHEWLVCCNMHRPADQQIEDDGVNSRVVTLCFALSLLGRRLLSTASNNQWNAALKSFLHGLHALFKGDFRVTAAKDEWVFADSDLALLRQVVAPAVRMALKLHQDHFTCVDEFDDNNVLYDTISSHEEQFVICHEGHPSWRQAVLNNRSNLLALRYVIDDGTDDYKIIMLNKRCLNFRVIKVNKECVRGLWAGQLQELIFLRNRNPERGSIQNAKQALRNMINSSCDQPIGYPIYVSPLTTSYCETNSFYNETTVGNLNGSNIKNFFRSCYMAVYNRFAGHCRNGGNPVEIEMSVYVPAEQNVNKAEPSNPSTSMKVPGAARSIRTASYASIPSSSNHSSGNSSTNGESSEIGIFPYFTEGTEVAP
ncbi:pecanex-like protein 1 isoform X2 [Clytia hemisphaerica]|uniref:pecanex-like protein 1 isoform X2 n=1 Tax=Clytia hemisphaerica TaxID=252671 RepID=UPI0034D66E55